MPNPHRLTVGTMAIATIGSGGKPRHRRSAGPLYSFPLGRRKGRPKKIWPVLGLNFRAQLRQLAATVGKVHPSCIDLGGVNRGGLSRGSPSPQHRRHHSDDAALHGRENVLNAVASLAGAGHVHRDFLGRPARPRSGRRRRQRHPGGPATLIAIAGARPTKQKRASHIVPDILEPKAPTEWRRMGANLQD